MKEQITSFITDLKSNKRLSSFDEASTKQAVVLRLLSFLDWDIFNVEEVYPDYAVNSSNVSYALRTNDNDKIFIEVKRIHEKLDKYQKKLVTLSSGKGVDCAVLTNGITWWFYLTAAEGNWQQKWFYSIDLFKQKPDTFVPKLIDLLNKTKVAKGQALNSAKKLFKNKKQKMAADFLPKSWNQIISQPNNIFVELLSLQTEKLCGYKVDIKSIETFLSKHIDKWLITNIPTAAAAPPSINMEPEVLDFDDDLPSPSSKVSARKDTAKKPETYADKSIQSFTFNGRTHSVRAWDEVLPTLCDYFADRQAADFEKVLWISDDQKPRFSRYSDQLRIPEKIKRTDIYVETKLNPDEVVLTAEKLLKEFGYSKNDLSIDTR
jgi:hypothetical protein